MVSFLFANNLINKICSVLQTTDNVKSEHSEAEANRNAEDAPMEMDEEISSTFSSKAPASATDQQFGNPSTSAQSTFELLFGDQQSVKGPKSSGLYSFGNSSMWKMWKMWKMGNKQFINYLIRKTL